MNFIKLIIFKIYNFLFRKNKIIIIEDLDLIICKNNIDDKAFDQDDIETRIYDADEIALYMKNKL